MHGVDVLGKVFKEQSDSLADTLNEDEAMQNSPKV